MVTTAPGLIPARFLTLLSHLTVLILIFFSREKNVKACMTIDYTESEFQYKESELVVGLGISIFLISIELLSFMSGISMFMPSAAIVSTGAHFSGSIALSYFIFDEWDCNLFWWVFSFCSILPALLEIAIGIQVLILKKI